MFGNPPLGVPVQQPGAVREGAGPAVQQAAGPAVPPRAETSERVEDQYRKETMEGDLASITVASRIATFWKDMPKLWFRQFEAITGPQKISKEAKFDLVISKLGREELSAVGDLLDAADRSYDELKTRLVSVFQESADRQFNRLVKEMELGDQKPSQLHRRMTEAARNAAVSDDTVRRLWLQRLPTASRAILTTVGEDTKTEDLVSMADKIAESMGAGVIAAVAAPSVPSSEVMSAVHSGLIAEFRNMALEIKQLKGEVSELRERPRARDYQQRRNRSRSRSRGPARGQNWLCRYHFKFRENAKRCIQPCAWGRPQQSAGGAPPAAYAWQPPQGN